MEKKYYFAYGSNMMQSQMEERTGCTALVGEGVLNDFELFVSHKSMRWKGGVFSIRKKQDHQVRGSVFEVDDNIIRDLDRYEGYPRVYRRMSVPVELEDGTIVEAIAYYSVKEQFAKVSESYLDNYLNACKQQGIEPSFYL